MYKILARITENSKYPYKFRPDPEI